MSLEGTECGRPGWQPADMVMRGTVSGLEPRKRHAADSQGREHRQCEADIEVQSAAKVARELYEMVGSLTLAIAALQRQAFRDGEPTETLLESMQLLERIVSELDKVARQL